MKSSGTGIEYRRLTSPRAADIAGLMPRWLAILTYTLALVLLLVVNFYLWITLIFPAWVLMISLFILWMRLKQPDGQPLTPK